MLARGPARLLILDDVWTDDQLNAFPIAGRAARLVTTRNPSLGGGSIMVPVRVDQMSQQQALALLQDGLPPLPHDVAAALVAEAGRWPLLLRLAGQALVKQVRLGADVTAAGEKLLVKLRQGGKLEMGTQAAVAGQSLDVANPVLRSRAVRATIEASAGLVGAADRERLAELSVFAEDEDIPVPLIAQLWQATHGMDEMTARALCAELADLALLSPAPDGGTVAMHDVIRDYLQEELGPARLAQLHQVLLDTTADILPVAAGGEPGAVTAWWELPGQARYLRDHLIGHMLAGGRPGQAEQVAADLRWVDARLRALGPAGPSADLALIGTPRAERLRRVLVQQAHLLAPTDPPHSLTDILYSRVSDDLDWGPQAKALAAAREQPALVNAWPLPDLGRPGLLRTFAGHTGPVNAVAIAPDGAWLATGGDDRTVRVWDAGTGRERAVLIGHTGPVNAVAIAPDGTWLATGSHDETVRVWDAGTGRERERAVRTSRRERVHGLYKVYVYAVAIAPDGTWLATGSRDATLPIWNAATGRRRTIRTGHTGSVYAVAIAPDGTWLATAGSDHTARILDAATGRERAVLYHTERVSAIAIAPGGTWLATASDDGTARIWDPVSRRERAVLAGHTGPVYAVAIAPDGTWLATGGDDQTVRVWDAATGRERAVLIGHSRAVNAVAIAPDGSWLATASLDGTARIWEVPTDQSRATKAESFPDMYAVAFAPDGNWLASGDGDGMVAARDAATGRERAVLIGHSRAVHGVAIAPDGSWLATASDDHTARIWDPVSGQEGAILAGHAGCVRAVAIAPDGTWLATASLDRTVRVWDAGTGRERTVLAGHTGCVRAVAIAPDGTWLATASDDGTVRIWDPASGRERTVLAGHAGWVTAVAIAPDGTWLATASDDGTARIWDPVSRRERTVLAGHTGCVRAVSFAPDGTWLATASDDRTLRIWNLLTGSNAATMRADTAIRNCVWSPSGRRLAATAHAGLYMFAL